MKLREKDYLLIHDEIKKMLKKDEQLEYYNCYSKKYKIGIIKSIATTLQGKGYTLLEISKIVNSLGYKTPTQGRSFTVYTIFRYLNMDD